MEGAFPWEEETGKEVKQDMGGVKARELWGVGCRVERKHSAFARQKEIQQSLIMKGLVNYDQNCFGKNHSD